MKVAGGREPPSVFLPEAYCVWPGRTPAQLDERRALGLPELVNAGLMPPLI